MLSHFDFYKFLCLVLIGIMGLVGCADTPSYQGASPLLTQNPLEDVLPPDIMPVVILSGSDYEMGYQYGAQGMRP